VENLVGVTAEEEVDTVEIDDLVDVQVVEDHLEVAIVEEEVDTAEIDDLAMIEAKDDHMKKEMHEGLLIDLVAHLTVKTLLV
jgi:hypothetical protein